MAGMRLVLARILTRLHMFEVTNNTNKVFVSDGDWTTKPIKRRHDGSYEIVYNSMPFHVPVEEAWQQIFRIVDDYATEHPDQVTDEPAPPVPSEAELLARARTVKTAEFDRAMADIDAELIRSTTDLVAAMLTPATLAADDDGTISLSDDELERSKTVFAKLRGIQLHNRALRAQVQAAATVEDVQAIEPFTVDRAALTEA